MAHKQFFKAVNDIIIYSDMYSFASYFINFSGMKKFISLQNYETLN